MDGQSFLPTMKTAQSMHGITLLDALIAILVISLGVFGILGIQLALLHKYRSRLR